MSVPVSNGDSRDQTEVNLATGTNRDRAVFDLLGNPRQWRQRAVERIDLTSALFEDRRRSVQAADLAGMLRPYIKRGHTHARLYLPIGTFPKGPLLDFAVTVDEKPAYLLPREAHGYFQAEYLNHLMLTHHGEELAPDVNDLLRRVCSFAPGVWQQLRQDLDSEREPVVAYLNATGLGTLVGKDPLEVGDVHDLVCVARSVGELVRQFAPQDVDSPSENPLLALPFLDAGGVHSLAVILATLEKLRNSLRLSSEHPVSEDRRFVATYADYGRHWDALVECVVPLERPFMIRTSEKRAVRLEEPFGEGSRKWLSDVGRKKAHQLINYGDASSNHVTCRITDSNVEFVSDGWRVLDERYGEIDALADAAEVTPEIVAFYDSKADRPNRLWLELPLRQTPAAAVGMWTVLFMIGTALISFLIFVFNWFESGRSHSLSGTDVAVILVPSAIAAALLLVREASTLSTRLNKYWRYGAAGVLGFLWLITLIFYGISKVKWGG
ncbi:hypothetical protein [Streptomyces nymphaeiformis]|uniref:Uncharacterized protein n=1 Tax=Streptomyces nymphaeiformis TaxID=2663842 RepID=A0A7W7XE02_9ACTN|nr:hypothetical protein [Streptomyces nymphaeiformis]MBB4984785.1 hypothetical protein [Streptomyces nymphaeiformis]